MSTGKSRACALPERQAKPAGQDAPGAGSRTTPPPRAQRVRPVAGGRNLISTSPSPTRSARALVAAATTRGTGLAGARRAARPRAGRFAVGRRATWHCFSRQEARALPRAASSASARARSRRASRSPRHWLDLSPNCGCRADRALPRLGAEERRRRSAEPSKRVPRLQCSARRPHAYPDRQPLLSTDRVYFACGAARDNAWRRSGGTATWTASGERLSARRASVTAQCGGELGETRKPETGGISPEPLVLKQPAR